MPEIIGRSSRTEPTGRDAGGALNLAEPSAGRAYHFSSERMSSATP